MHKIFFYNKFIIHLYMFRALCAHHQKVKIVLYSIWYTPVGGRPVHRLRVEHVEAYNKLIIKEDFVH